MDTSANQSKSLRYTSELMLNAMTAAIRLREAELESMDVSEGDDHARLVDRARAVALLQIEEAIAAALSVGNPTSSAKLLASLTARNLNLPTPTTSAAPEPSPLSPVDEFDAKSAQGQNRTTKTKWEDLLPYIRFRYERVREALPASGTVYEMGCGTGVTLNHLATSRPDLTFIGLDNSQEALMYGRHHFGSTPNLTLLHTPDFASVAETIAPNSFLVAMEVIEHLDDEQLEFFKRTIMQNVDEAVFSFPYNEKNIAGTNHLQSIDIYTIFEIFPGFRTLFMRRNSIKFIGHWKRASLPYVVEHLKLRDEDGAIERICNWNLCNTEVADVHLTESPPEQEDPSDQTVIPM